jgi:hypothetical protein
MTRLPGGYRHPDAARLRRVGPPLLANDVVGRRERYELIGIRDPLIPKEFHVYAHLHICPACGIRWIHDASRFQCTVGRELRCPLCARLSAEEKKP